MEHDRAIRDEVAAAAEHLGADGEEFRALARARLYEALEDLGADGFLLAAVGSWGDTLTDGEALDQLRRWNRGDPPFDHLIASTGGRE
jgi:hypothetical protein